MRPAFLPATYEDGRTAAPRLALVLALIGLLVAVPSTARANPLQRVTIGGTTYVAGDALAVAARIPRTPATAVALKVVRSCKGIRALGFASASGGGVVAWLPTNFNGCLGASGGGPARPSPSCLNYFRTPSDTDPMRVSGGRANTTRYWVLIAGTSTRACADLSTQVPGGVWGTTTASVSGLPAGTALVVKCQLRTSQGLFDYLAPYSPSLPASKRTYWVNDAFVATGGTRLSGVPSCDGRP